MVYKFSSPYRYLGIVCYFFTFAYPTFSSYEQTSQSSLNIVRLPLILGAICAQGILFPSPQELLQTIKKAELLINNFDEDTFMQNKGYREEIESNFFKFFQSYKLLLLREKMMGESFFYFPSPERKNEIENNIRKYEKKIAPYYVHYRGKLKDSSNINSNNVGELWKNEDELEMRLIRNQGDLDDLLQELSLNKGKMGWNCIANFVGSMKEILQRGGTSTLNINSFLPPKFFRLPSNFKGTKFLVGGERSCKSDKKHIYILNFNKNFHPDILGLAEDITCYMALPSNHFFEVEFDHIGNEILLDNDVLKECTRTLVPEGKFIFKTHRSTQQFYEENKEEIEQAKRNLNNLFQDVKMEFKEDNSWGIPEGKYYYSFIATNKNCNSPGIKN